MVGTVILPDLQVRKLRHKEAELPRVTQAVKEPRALCKIIDQEGTLKSE